MNPVARIGHATVLGMRDDFDAPVRTILVWLQLFLTTVALMVGTSLWQDSAQQRDSMNRLESSAAVAFRVIPPDPPTAPEWPGEPLYGLLSQGLTPTGHMMSIIFQGYPTSVGDDRQIIVVLGTYDQSNWPQTGDENGLLIGAEVQELQVGQVVDMGKGTEPVLARLSEKSRLVNHADPWGPPVETANLVIFKTSFAHFADTVRGDANGLPLMNDTLLSNLVYLFPTDEGVDRLVDAVATSTDRRILPYRVGDSDEYQSMRMSAVIVVLVAVGLIGMAAVSLISLLGHTIRRTLQDHGVHRLYGAAMGDIRVRLAATVVISFVAPAVLLLLAWRSVPIPQSAEFRQSLAIFMMAVVVMGVLAVELGAREIRRRALTLATRGVE
jgi:hypothetical protein